MSTTDIAARPALPSGSIVLVEQNSTQEVRRIPGCGSSGSIDTVLRTLVLITQTQVDGGAGGIAITSNVNKDLWHTGCDCLIGNHHRITLVKSSEETRLGRAVPDFFNCLAREYGLPEIDAAAAAKIPDI